jgi:geranylgeranyl pyrophosphate synthase
VKGDTAPRPESTRPGPAVGGADPARLVRPLVGEDLLPAYAEHLQACRAEIDEAFAAAPLALVRRAQRHGKLVRGLLTFVGATAVGVEPGRVVQAAAAIELLHAASLVHDDLVDGSPTRRGLPSLHVHLGRAQALVIGDHMLMSGCRSMTRLRESFPPQRVLLALDAFLSAAQRCALGELADVERATPASWDAGTAADKAGSLFAFSASAAAILAEAGEDLVAALARYGLHVGIAYQARDDSLDADPGDRTTSPSQGTTARHAREAVRELRGLPIGVAVEQLEVIASFAVEHDA